MNTENKYLSTRIFDQSIFVTGGESFPVRCCNRPKKNISFFPVRFCLAKHLRNGGGDGLQIGQWLRRENFCLCEN